MLEIGGRAPNIPRSSGFGQGVTVPPLLGSFQSYDSSGRGALLAASSRAPPGSLRVLNEYLQGSSFTDTTWLFTASQFSPKSTTLHGIHTLSEGLRLSWQQREPPPPAGEQGMGSVTSTQIPHPGHAAEDESRVVKAESPLSCLSSRGLHRFPCGHLADEPGEECNELCRWEVLRSGCSRGAGSRCFVYKHRQDD